MKIGKKKKEITIGHREHNKGSKNIGNDQENRCMSGHSSHVMKGEQHLSSRYSIHRFQACKDHVSQQKKLECLIKCMQCRSCVV